MDKIRKISITVGNEFLCLRMCFLMDTSSLANRQTSRGKASNDTRPTTERTAIALNKHTNYGTSVMNSPPRL
ncbi:hypothetical protein KIN20_019013 [Parelaphostrongylus tenuis]|uniref:Uncharacterized protein n=1 Tax=Parelaphostrongylus tenuis TaxID=148309 RepID=A0AAD5QSI7_PARTN|nr:hypothetical protein KIN20_019013 [Parelaphostrongylus tenuis]